MKAAKRKRLDRAGWRLASTEEFLELSDEEKALVEYSSLWPMMNE